MAKQKSASDSEKIKNEFLIFKIDQYPKVNNTYKLLGLANSASKAKDLIDKLSSTETGRIVILEKKGYYERKPVMALKELDENIANE